MVIQDLINATDTLRKFYQHVRIGTQPRLGFQYGSDEVAAMGDAVSKMESATADLQTAIKALRVYAAASFYERLEPSLALEDKGSLAKMVLGQLEGTTGA